MPAKIDLTGKRFGRWTVLEGIKVEGKNRPYYLCICECGTRRVVKGQLLSNGSSQSCGCWKNEKLSERCKTHGLTRKIHRLYYIWHSMVDRCHNSESSNFTNYGGRRIRVCDEWRNDYAAFYAWAINNGYSNELTIDRFPNNDGNYEPTNCRWATRKEQIRNRRATKTYLFFNEYWHLGEIADTFDLNYQRIFDRIYKGWNVNNAVFGKKEYNLWA